MFGVPILQLHPFCASTNNVAEPTLTSLDIRCRQCMLSCAGSLCTEVSTSKKHGITFWSCKALVCFHLLWSCLPGTGKAVRQPVGLRGSLFQSAQSTGTAEPEEDCNAAISNLTSAAYAVA